MISEPGIYIGIGMVLSLFLTETLGVTAGGIIVPGYIAMNLENPERLVITFGVSIITFLLIKLLSKYIMVYGKRRLRLSFQSLPVRENTPLYELAGMIIQLEKSNERKNGI